MALTGRNISFPIKNADGTAFHDLVLHKATYDSVVMSLGDKITGDVYYKDNHLAVTMQEYIEYDGVKFVLVNPPTIVREGMVSDNSGLNGMTKYSFEFYHPMYMLANFSFTDIAVTQDEERYLSQNKTFSWIGTCFDFIDKLNANLNGTQWFVESSGNEESATKMAALSEVLSFDNNSIADALKTAYETWEVPFTVSPMPSTHQQYANGKRFLITFGLPSNEILDSENAPFVFRFGQGVGLKNNSRTPKNNKIITRIAGYGSEDNIPYGYPQIVWTGNEEWEYSINNRSGLQPIMIDGEWTTAYSYPLYKGIVGGQYVKLIKHPFTRTHLMPSVYVERVNKKVNPFATGYDPEIEIIDYYDATGNSYPNNIIPNSPSYDIHAFEDIKPELGNETLVAVLPFNDTQKDYISFAAFESIVDGFMESPATQREYDALNAMMQDILHETPSATDSFNGGAYTYKWSYTSDDDFYYVKYVSGSANIDETVLKSGHTPSQSVSWDDTIDEDGNYKQSYFKITLPQLSFDLYASAAITQEMTVNMRSGACMGCTFPIEVDWDDYKANFYDSDGNFAPNGTQRDLDKYPKSNLGRITVLVKKEIETFGTLMPNIYQQPAAGDKFVVFGISLPTSYISDAESRLDADMMQYMLDNNVHYYEYPLKFDEHFLATHTDILTQIRNNSIVRFEFAGVENVLYVKQITIKYGEKVLPQYDITLTDDVEIVLNQIGQVTDDVSRIRVQMGELQKYYSQNIIDELNSKLSRIADDVCMGRITFQQGLDSIGSAIFRDEIRSPQFETGLYTGRGWRIDQLGNAEFESLRIRSFLEVVELIINRLQAQEGDTMFTDNDQIDKVDVVVDETDGSVSYILSLKEKWDGYVTSQMYGNILKGTINTLAARQAGVSDESSNNPNKQGSDDGGNRYYTSWMRVIATHNTSATLGVNQIQVVLYGDDYVPAQKNFAPCELMVIARWGCIDYSDPSDPDYESIKASIVRRQRMFMISTTEGRVVKYTGVDAPILKNGNYGVTIGELPEFVKNYTEVHKVLYGYYDSYGNWIEGVGEHTDWLYAQGIVVGNYIKVDKEGLPVPVTVFCGEWEDGSTMQEPTVGHGIYFYNEYNEDTQQYEIHEVRHNGGRWQCLQHQPVVSGGVATYYEPKWNSPYWRLVDGNDNLTIEFGSSKGYSFRRGAVDTIITPYVFYGNVDITDEIAEECFNWTRYEQANEELQNPYTAADEAWNAAHAQQKTLHLTNNDMPNTWSTQNKIIFTLTVSINDGKTTRIVDNQIIS